MNGFVHARPPFNHTAICSADGSQHFQRLPLLLIKCSVFSTPEASPADFCDARGKCLGEMFAMVMAGQWLSTYQERVSLTFVYTLSALNVEKKMNKEANPQDKEAKPHKARNKQKSLQKTKKKGFCTFLLECRSC